MMEDLLKQEAMTIENEFMEYAKANGSKHYKRYPRQIKLTLFTALGFDHGEGNIKSLYPELGLNPKQLYAFNMGHSFFCQALKVGMQSQEHYREIYQWAKVEVEAYAQSLKMMHEKKGALNAKAKDKTRELL